MKKLQKLRRSFAVIGVLLLCMVTIFTISGAAYQIEYIDYVFRNDLMIVPPRDKLWVDTSAGLVSMSEAQYRQLQSASFQIYNIGHVYDGGGYGASGSCEIAWTDEVSGSTFGGLWIIDHPYTSYRDGFEARYVDNVALLDFCVDETFFRIYSPDDLEHPVDYAPMDATIYVVEDDPTHSSLVLAEPGALDVDFGDACEDAWGYRPYTICYASYVTGLMGSYSAGYAEGWDQGWIDGNTQGYDLGHYDGFRAGQTDVLNGNATLKDLIFSIFSAPVDLINGILDFDLFGINFASLVRSLITLAVVGIALVLYFKFSKGG